MNRRSRNILVQMDDDLYEALTKIADSHFVRLSCFSCRLSTVRKYPTSIREDASVIAAHDKL